MLPSLQQSRLVARKMACQSNQRQMGIASHAYASDDRAQALPYNTEFPGEAVSHIDHISNRAHWMMKLVPYVANGLSAEGYSPLGNNTKAVDKHFKIFLCPLTGSLPYYGLTGRCYTWNAALTTGRPDLPPTHASYYPSVSLSRLRAPQSNIWLVAEAGHYGSHGYSFIDYTVNNTLKVTLAGEKHHDRAINFLFVDGHVESLKKGQRGDIMARDYAVYGW
jgi:prepilin-type processing-associated H-X9-DG protein